MSAQPGSAAAGISFSAEDGAMRLHEYFDAMLRHLRRRKDVVFRDGEQIYDWFRAQGQP